MSWFSKKRNIAITVVAGVLALAAIVLIIYGVVTHDEESLLRVCRWTGEGWAVYEEGATEVEGEPCEGAEELVWPAGKVPFSVAAIEDADQTVYAEGAKQREALDSAIRDINQQFGFRLLRASSDPLSAAFVAHLGAAVDIDRRGGGGGAGAPSAKALGWAKHHRADSSGKSLRCHLWVRRDGSLRVEYLVAHHELLHCIGFAHDDDNPASAMYPFTYDDTMWDRMQAARVTDSDRARGRDLYRR